MNFFPAMAIRGTDANEARYVRRAMRSLAGESVAVVLVSLFLIGLGVFAIGYAFVDSDKALGSIVVGVISVMSGGAMTYSASVKWWRSRGRAPVLVYRVEGRMFKVSWRDSEGNLHEHWELADHRLVVPAHWDGILEQVNPYGTVIAEVVPGPDNELIPLIIGDRLSVRHDVQQGLLSVPSKGWLVVWATVAAFFVGCLFATHTDEFRGLEFWHRATIVLGALSLVPVPWVIVTLVRLHQIQRRLIRHLPPSKESEKTPLPTARR